MSDKGEYKCNFLWPYDDDSWESFIYGIANANTEEYAEVIWKEMKERITTITEENAKLRAALENSNQLCKDYNAMHQKCKAERDEAIVTAYNRGAALEEIAGFPNPKFAHEGAYESVWNIARNAIGGKG